MISAEELRNRAQGAMSLHIAFIGVVNGLFSALHRLQTATPAESGPRAVISISIGLNIAPSCGCSLGFLR